jgi:hypothetical protein
VLRKDLLLGNSRGFPKPSPEKSISLSPQTALLERVRGIHYFSTVNPSTLSPTWPADEIDRPDKSFITKPPKAFKTNPTTFLNHGKEVQQERQKNCQTLIQTSCRH